MNDLHRRWFEPTSITDAVANMLRKCQSVPVSQLAGVQEDRDKSPMKMAPFAGGGALACLVVLIVVLLMFAKPEKGKKPQYGRLAMLCVLIVGGAGAGVYHVCGNNKQKRANRDEAFNALCRQSPHLRSARRTEIVGDCVGTVPWFMSEEWIHAYGLASGVYEGDGMIVVECTHVIDPILTTTDSKVLQGLSGLVSKKHQRLHLRAMEGVVFAMPLEGVSDLIVVPQMDASRAYYKRALNDQECDLSHVFKLPRRLRTKYWMAAAAPEECEGLFATNLPALLDQRKWCIVQVVGGHCVVMTSQWHGNRPGQAPQTEAAITENLKFSQSVYRELQRLGGGGVSAAAAEKSKSAIDRATTVELARELADSEAALAPAAAPRLKTRGSRRPHSLLSKFLLFGIGVPLFLFGALGTLGIWLDSNQGKAARDWPQIEAVVVDSSIDVTDSGRFSPLVSYEYEVNGREYNNDRIQYGPAQRTRDKQEVEQLVARYPEDAAVTAFYNPDRPHCSVLVPGLRDESRLTGLFVFGGGLALAGMLMCGYGAIGRKRRAAT